MLCFVHGTGLSIWSSLGLYCASQDRPVLSRLPIFSFLLAGSKLIVSLASASWGLPQRLASLARPTRRASRYARRTARSLEGIPVSSACGIHDREDLLVDVVRDLLDVEV